MPVIRNDRRLGGNLRQPRGLGLTFADAADVSIQDYGAPQLDVYSAPVSDQPQPGDIISDPIAPPAYNVTPTTTVVTDTSGGTVAMPTTTTATADGSGKTIASVQELPNATVTTYTDGSSSAVFKSQMITDPECVNETTADINAGLLCQSDPTGFETRYIPTERWTGQVQSWGELRANMAYAAQLNSQFPASARRIVWYNNPSWHSVGQVYEGSWNFPDDYTPSYIGPTETSGGNTMSIVDPNGGANIDITGGILDPDAPATDSGQSINDLIYGPVDDRAPGQPGYVPPVYMGPPLDETGSVITPNGGSYSGPITTPGGGVRTTVNADGGAPPSGNNGTLLLVGLAALLLFKRSK